MIRGPVLPQLRASLWSLVRHRLDAIETGLALVLEGLDCGAEPLGAVDGLARDALGGPVLVVLAVEGDALLLARVLAAGDFVQRVGDSLARAIPEGSFRPGVPGRVLVVGSDSAAAALDTVRRLPVANLEVCSLAPFRVAGSERFAVRWLRNEAPAAPAPSAGPPAGAAADPAFVVVPARRELWASLAELCQRIDPEVQFDGDRYSRRITWRGHLLGELRAVDGALLAGAATGAVRDLREMRDVRWFCDQLMRAFAREAGLESPTEAIPPEPPRAAETAPRFSAAPRHAAQGRRPSGADSLRATLAAARLSPEEYSALGAPAASAGDSAEGSHVAEDGTRPSVRGVEPGTGGNG